MKWLSFRSGNRNLYGFVVGDDVIDFPQAAAALDGSSGPRTLLELVENGSAALQQARRVAAALADGELQTERFPLSAIIFEPPIRRPSKILGVPINNASIGRWGYRAWTAPAFFLKPPSALIGHGSAVNVRTRYGLTHPEPELAAIIGKTACEIEEAEVLDHVFGFTIINDITSPGLKEEDSIALNMPQLKGPAIGWRPLSDEQDNTIYLTYHARSKGCDTFAPMGPWVVTPDELGDPNQLAIRGWIGDELVTEDSTANLTFKVEQVIAQASRFMTLEPGDVIHFGMAAVPAMPDKYPTTWDLDISQLEGPLAVDIEGIGRLVNPVSKAD